MKISCESCYTQYCSQNDINFEGSNISCLSLLTRRWYSNGIRPVAQLWRFMIQFSPDAFALLHNTKFLQHFFFLFDINHESLKKYQRKNSFQQKFLFEFLFTLLKQKRTNYQSRFDSMHSSLGTCLNYRFTIILVNPCGVQKRTSSVIIRSWWTRHYSLTPLFSLVRTSCSRPSTLYSLLHESNTGVRTLMKNDPWASEGGREIDLMYRAAGVRVESLPSSSCIA